MRNVDCPREQEIVNAVLGRRWPDGCDEELHEHAANCEICKSVTTVASLIHDDHVAMSRDIRVPGAGQVWWRSAVRARLEAAQTVSRPLTWLQGLAGASVAGFAVALFGFAWPMLRDVTSRVSSFASSMNPNATEVVAVVGAAGQQILPLLLVAGACVILAPIALYFALSDE